MSEQYIAEFKGFSREEIEEMVRAKYGNFIFEDQGNGTLVCYPTARGQVTVRSLSQVAKERSSCNNKRQLSTERVNSPPCLWPEHKKYLLPDDRLSDQKQ